MKKEKGSLSPIAKSVSPFVLLRAKHSFTCIATPFEESWQMPYSVMFKIKSMRRQLNSHRTTPYRAAHPQGVEVVSTVEAVEVCFVCRVQGHIQLSHLGISRSSEYLKRKVEINTHFQQKSLMKISLVSYATII